jgi:hypothetical protein
MDERLEEGIGKGLSKKNEERLGENLMEAA